MAGESGACSWSSGLPDEILASIFERLPLRDQIRCTAVCSSWRGVGVLLGSAPGECSPWLLLSTTDCEAGRHKFYSISHGGQELSIRIRLPLGWACCVNSCDGWLMVVDRMDNLCMLNPLTQACVCFPPIPSCKFSKAVVAWTSPATYIVMALTITFCHQRLAFIREGDAAWNWVEQHPSCHFYIDLIYCQGKGSWFLLDRLGRVDTVDLSGAAPLLVPEYSVRLAGTLVQGRHLVESSGELFQVVKSYQHVGYVARRTRFQVFKLEESGQQQDGQGRRKWIMVNNLGGHSVFLGRNNPVSISIDESSPAGLKGDCIYFTDDYWSGKDRIIRYTGAFNLQDGRIRSCYNDESQTIQPQLPSGYDDESQTIQPRRAWFVPNLSKQGVGI